jgi:hypothetical protein
MPRYRITSGTFRDSDDSVKGVGDEIEMGEDIARQHAGSLELLDAPAPVAETITPPAVA